MLVKYVQFPGRWRTKNSLRKEMPVCYLRLLLHTSMSEVCWVSDFHYLSWNLIIYTKRETRGGVQIGSADEPLSHLRSPPHPTDLCQTQQCFSLNRPSVVTVGQSHLISSIRASSAAAKDTPLQLYRDHILPLEE